MRIPGFDTELRVTTSADVFDDHFESHDFLSPGGRIFELLANSVNMAVEPGEAESTGRIWLAQKQGTDVVRFYVARDGAVAAISSFEELLEFLSHPSPLSKIPPETTETFRHLDRLA